MRVFTKGAAEVVLDLCTHAAAPGGRSSPLDAAARAELLGSFQQGGQRMLCLAYRDVIVPTASLPSLPGGSGGDDVAGGAIEAVAASAMSSRQAHLPHHRPLASPGRRQEVDSTSLRRALPAR